MTETDTQTTDDSTSTTDDATADAVAKLYNVTGDEVNADGSLKTEDSADDKLGDDDDKNSDDDAKNTDDDDSKKSADDDADKDDDKDDSLAKYEKFDMPEGEEIHQETLDSFSKMALEAKLTQEQAQALVTWQGEQTKTAREAMEETDTAEVVEWGKQVKDDKELGGSNFEGTTEAVSRVMSNKLLVTPELKTFLQESGLGNHPELVRMVARFGHAIGEDGIISGNAIGGKTSATTALYDHPDSKALASGQG